jgi:hypothetical protein
MLPWEKIPEVEAALERLFLAAKSHSSGQPYDATGCEGDVGEAVAWAAGAVCQSFPGRCVCRWW